MALQLNNLFMETYLELTFTLCLKEYPLKAEFVKFWGNFLLSLLSRAIYFLSAPRKHPIFFSFKVEKVVTLTETCTTHPAAVKERPQQPQLRPPWPPPARPRPPRPCTTCQVRNYSFCYSEVLTFALALIAFRSLVCWIGSS